MRFQNRQKIGNKIKILIADHEAIFRLGLKRLLGFEDDLRVVAQAENAPQVLAMLKTFRPDLIIIQEEIASDGNHNLFGQIHRQRPECKIIATASALSKQMQKELIEAGAAGIISKTDHPEVFVKSVRLVVQGEVVMPRTSFSVMGSRGVVSDNDRQPRPVDTLTRRERTIVSYLTQGFRNRQIAGRLDIAEQTVKNHLRSIYDKVGVSDRLELVLYAIHQKLELPSVEV